MKREVSVYDTDQEYVDPGISVETNSGGNQAKKSSQTVRNNVRSEEFEGFDHE